MRFMKNSEGLQRRRLDNIVKKVLLVFISISVVFAVYKNWEGSNWCRDLEEKTSQSVVDAKDKKQRDDTIKDNESKKDYIKKLRKELVVYYFYTTSRCYSCLLIEQYTKEAVERNFGNGYNGWKVEFVGVNIENPENRHFISEYSLRSKSVILQKVVNGRKEEWKNLMKVWYLVGNKEMFISYITQEIKELLR